MKKNKSLFSWPSAFMKESHFILTSTLTPARIPLSQLVLVDPLGELAFSLRHLPLTYVPDTSGLSRTQICHHQFFYLQGLLCKAWEVIPLLPSLILVGDCCLLGDKYSDFETCYLVENLNVSAIYLCFVSWWIYEDRDGRGKSLRSAISPLNVMKLQKKNSTMILSAGDKAVRWLLRYYSRVIGRSGLSESDLARFLKSLQIIYVVAPPLSEVSLSTVICSQPQSKNIK